MQGKEIFLQYHVLGRDVGQVNVVRSHGSETGEDLGEGRYDVVLQVAARGREASECRCILLWQIIPCLAWLSNFWLGGLGTEGLFHVALDFFIKPTSVAWKSNRGNKSID